MYCITSSTTSSINMLLFHPPTRATFETSNYPRRPCDRYTAPNSKCIGAEPPFPPPQKKKNEKSNRPGLKKLVAQWNSLVTWKLVQYPYLSKVWKPNCQLVKSFTCGCFVDTVRLPCAFRFAPIFMVQSHFQYCCQSIKKIHIIIET